MREMPKEVEIQNMLGVLIQGYLANIPKDSPNRLLHLQYILTVLSDEIDTWATLLSPEPG